MLWYICYNYLLIQPVSKINRDAVCCASDVNMEQVTESLVICKSAEVNALKLLTVSLSCHTSYLFVVSTYP